MAYTTVFTKEPVQKIDDDNYLLTIGVVVNDGAVIIKEAKYSVRYNDGWSIDYVVSKFQQIMKEDWDKTADEKLIFDKPALNTMINTVKSSFDTYINQ